MTFGDVKYFDSEKNLVYEIDVAGFNKDNLKVKLNNGILNITGDRDDHSHKQAGKKSIHKRLNVGEVEKIEAKAKDGILYVTLTRPDKNTGRSTKIEIN